MKLKKRKMDFGERLMMLKCSWFWLFTPIPAEMRIKTSWACFKAFVNGWVWEVEDESKESL